MSASIASVADSDDEPVCLRAAAQAAGSSALRSAALSIVTGRPMAASAAAMKKIADAADPLYKTLDDGQKRRLAVLTGMGHGFGEGGWRQRHFERGMDGGDGSRDRGFDRDRHDRDGGPGRGGPERL